MSHNPFVVTSSEVLGNDSTNELLVTYKSGSGEEQCAIVKVGDSYEEMLAEACLSLDPWLPPDWEDRHRYFAREVRTPGGDMIWATIQPSLATELARAGRLPALRLMSIPPAHHESSSTSNNLGTPHEQSPAYEARTDQTIVDGIVQAVLHRLYYDDAAPAFNSAFKSPITRDTKVQPQNSENEATASGSAYSGDTLLRHVSTPPHPSLPLPVPHPDHLGKRTRFAERTLQVSSRLLSESKHEAAIRFLRSAYHSTTLPQERAQFFLWLGQIGCDIAEYTNAGCDIAMARDIFIALEDRAGRIQCDSVLARIARERTGINRGEDATLTQLLAEARRHGLEAVQVQLLCEIGRLGCSGNEVHEKLASIVEQAEAGARRLGDTWLKAESSRIAGMVREVAGDHLSALQAYSTALELYWNATPQSPLSPIKEVEAQLQRMKDALARTPEKPKGRFRKFF